MRRPHNPAFRTGDELTDLSSEAVIIFGLDGAIQYWNPAASELYRFSADEVMGHDLVALLDCSSALLGDKVQKQLSKTEKWRGIVQRKTSEQAHIDVSVRWTLRINENGLPDAVIEFGRALEAEESVAQLKVREERFQALFHKLPVALMLADAQGIGQILRKLKEGGIADLNTYLDEHPLFLKEAMNGALIAAANEKAVSTLGANESGDLYDSAEHIWSVSPQTFKRTLVARYEGNFQFGEETRILTLDGRVIDAMFTIAFPPPEDRMGMSLLCITDITAVKATENRLKKIQADFAHSSRVAMLGELVATIAHELNQPLGAIALNAAAATRWLSREEPAAEQAKARIEEIAAETKRASEMIRRIRVIITKHDAGNVEVDLNSIVTEVLLFLTGEIENRSVQVTTNLSTNSPRILGDRILVQQVLLNLLTNSLEAFDDKHAGDRTIRVGTSENVTTGMVTLTIQDSGTGIAAENLHRVFDGFFSTKDDGLGMGLSICHSIIAAYGGDIKFERGLRVGAAAVVTLPSAELGRVNHMAGTGNYP